MSNKKPSLSTLMSNVGKKEEPQKPTGEGSAPGHSRLTPPSQKSESFMQMPRQSLVIELPVSKRQVSCSHMPLDPQQVFVGSYNKRAQGLLSENDPAMQDLMTSMAQGQRDPVLVRAIKDGPDTRYELIYGSRRRFAAELLNQRQPGGFKLRAWVSAEIPEVDARKLSHAENNEREDISNWEQAIYLKRIQDQNPTWTQEVIAFNEGIPQGTVSRLLALASIPEDLIRLLVSPKALGVKTGAKLASVWSKQPSKRQAQAAGQLAENAPYDSDKALMAALAQCFDTKKLAIREGKKTRLISDDEKCVVWVGRHRTKPNNYNLELDGINEEQLAELTKWVAKTLRLKER